jgi:hypothetical protein
VQAGDLSPDRLWRWDGARWVPAAPPPVARQAPGSGRSWLPIAGALAAIVAAVLVIVACALPYAHYNDPSITPSSPSVFNTGGPGALWFAAEPVIVALFGVAAAVVLLAWNSRLPRATTSGMLLAFGVQTIFLFLGYVGQGASGQPVQAPGPGGLVGMFAGMLLLVGGILGAISVFERPSPEV